MYSTPQAVIADREGRLAYRGNYNVSRYCTDPKTPFVRIALEKLTTIDAVTIGGGVSQTEQPAYGCELPSNRQGANLVR